MTKKHEHDEETTQAPAEPVKTDVPPPDLLTEQEKGNADPIEPAQPPPGPAQTIEELGISPRQPYPSKEGS